MREFKLTALMAATSFMLCSGLMTNNRQMYWMASVLAFLMLSNYLLLRKGVGRVTVECQCPSEVTEGERVPITIQIRMPLRWTVLATEVNLHLPNAFVQERIEYSPPMGGTQQVDTEVLAIRRGHHTLGPVELTLTDPFGLFTTRQTVALESGVVVLPRAVPLPMWHWSAGGHGQYLMSSALRGQRGEGTDWHGTRPYIPGDPLRRINWRATARHEEWHVKEFETSQIVPLVIALEQAPRWQQQEGSIPEFDQAIRHIAWLMMEAPRHGVQVSLLQPDLSEISVSMASAQSLRQFLRQLALLQPTAERSLIDSLPQLVQQYGNMRRLILFVPPHERAYYESALHPFVQQGYAVEVIAPVLATRAS